MSSLLPHSRPKATIADLTFSVSKAGRDLATLAAEYLVLIVGIRGYYKNSLGKPGVNDRDIYDDAIFLVERQGDGSLHLWAYNANTDPAKYRNGIATLVPGLYFAIQHRHHGKYAAFQLVKDTVTRDGQKGTFTGCHGINIHYGGSTDTFSEGCQTLPKPQFLEFQPLAYHLMDKHDVTRIPYLLIEN